MLDLGLALIDLCLWLGGDLKPQSVSASFNWDEDADGIEDAGCALIKCATGCSIIIDVSWRYLGEEEKFWLEVLGSKGSASVSLMRVFKELNGSPIDVTPGGASGRENSFVASHRAGWASLLAAIRGDIAVPDIEEQLAAHRILDAINKAAESGGEIEV